MRAAFLLLAAQGAMSAEPFRLDFLPAPSAAGFHNSSLWSWGGGVVAAEGAFHLFASAFLNGCGLGSWGSNSVAIHAVGTSPLGPFSFVERALPYYHHNVAPAVAPDGTFLLFAIGMVPDPKPARCADAPLLQHGFESVEAWSASSVHGPWTPVPGTINGRNLFNGTNPAPAFHPSKNGTLYVMSHNSGSMLVSEAPSWRGPYAPPLPVFSTVSGTWIGEDPFLWWDGTRVNQEGGTGAWRVLYHAYDKSDPAHQFSVGGYAESLGHDIFGAWSVQSHSTPAFTTNFTAFLNGSSGPVATTTFGRRERPKLYLDPATGAPAVLYTGVCPEGSSDCFTTAAPIAPAAVGSSARLPAPPAAPPEALVWPFHGTSGANGLGGWASSEVPIGAHLPFGGMRLGPDTTVCWEGADWWWRFNHYGGYFYNDSCVRAFSHTHLQGAGLADAGAVGVMVSRALPVQSTLPTPLNPAPYRVSLNHSSEVSRPGFYAVDLPEAASRAELTVSGLRSGLHRYTCHSDGRQSPCVLLIDACHKNHDQPCGPGALSLEGGLLAVNATENGSFGSDCGGVPVHLTFSITASGPSGAALPILSSGRWCDGALAPGDGTSASTGASGSLGAFYAFAAPPSGAVEILVRVALSHVSPAGAQANLVAEQGSLTLSFDDAAAQAYAAWGAALSAIVVNDVGFSAADTHAHWRALAADAAAHGEASERMRALHTPSGAGSSGTAAAAAANAAARAAARAHLLQQRSKRAAPLPSAEEEEALITSFLAASPNPAFAQASWDTSLPGLGIPAAPRGLPPAERLGSFYSSLYHALAAPTTYSDSDGSYKGLDGAIHRATWPGGAWLSDLSLWDVYRSQTPLLVLLAPAAASNLFFSAIADFNASGRPPHWVFANCETGCMPGSHGLGVLADFLVKGVEGPPAQQVLAAAIAGLTPQDGGDYSVLGYVPFEGNDDCTSLTLDYAFDDACGALIASLAGPAGAPYAAVWGNRSRNYRNMWNPQAGAMCPRWRNGSFPECPPLDLPPILLNKYYTEGDGLQYTFSVPHDLQGLRQLFPSDANYTALLQTLMVNTPLWPTNALPNPWYWAGNEPDVLAPWQFSVVPGQEWRTQYWVRWILDTYYQLQADGCPGNDDFGELNAWAVWACLGLYPLTASPGGSYVLSSPCFKNVTVTSGATQLNIIAHNFSASTVYVTRAALNGAPLPTPFVNHSDLLTGGESVLEYWLTDTPCAWGGGPVA